MTVYPHDFSVKIGFNEIQSLVADLCQSTAAKNIVFNLPLITESHILNEKLNETEEFVHILQYESNIPANEYEDIRGDFSNIHISGSYLQVETLSKIKLIASTIKDWQVFFKKEKKDQYQKIFSIINSVDFPNEINLEINRILDDNNEIKDNASENLLKIRKELRSKQNLIIGRINRIFSQLRKDGYIDDHADITIRNGRAVIPMSAAHKRAIKGFIHDESATGQTVFIEPAEIFEANNEIRELEIQEQRETIQILSLFAEFLRPYVPLVLNAIETLIYLDFLRAKARFSLKINAIKPIIRENDSFRWVKAKHPLLFLHLEKQQRSIVPLTIEMNEQQRIVIISGPNAGGKSVCLKTVGLIQFMFQHGFLVPVEEGSIFRLFNQFFIDIGDEQNIDNDLSTYSSHLINLKNLIDLANKDLLFLIDEFGAGTEPQIGSAIAQAVIDIVLQKAAYGLITTHDAQLKLMADNYEGIVNASMLFDTQILKPLFILQMGKPGSSYALEIAKNIGLQAEVLAKAREKMNNKQFDFDEQLQLLEKEKSIIEKKQKEIELADQLLHETLEKYNKLCKKIEETKNQIILQAKAEAKEIINQANRTIELTIKQIKEHQAEKELTKKLRQEVDKLANEISAETPINIEKISRKQKKVKKDADSENKNEIIYDESGIGIGDFVQLLNQEEIGEVVNLSGNEIMVIIGNVTLKTQIEKVKKIRKKNSLANSEKEIGIQNRVSQRSLNLPEKMAAFKTVIDIRGNRAEEASAIVKKFIDDAILLSIPEVKIIHGKGNGVLRTITREILQQTPEVIRYYDERIEFGGHGATIVSFR